MTIAQKILSRSAQADAKVGDTLMCKIDKLMCTESFRGVASILKEAGIKKVWDPEKIMIVFDHYVPASDEASATIHAGIREQVEKFGIKNFYDVNAGISHQIMMEKGHVLPGELIVGADSHSTMYGALGAAGTGVGGTEAAYISATGNLWLVVPETILFYLRGELRPGVMSKDLVLYIAGKIKSDGASYKAIEWRGDGANSLSVESRMTVSNMAVELGAKFGFFEFDKKAQAYLTALGLPQQNYELAQADKDAEYCEKYEIDLSTLEPQVAAPYSPDNVRNLSEVKGVKIHQALLSSCTNARIEDLRLAAQVMRGRKIAKHVRMYVSPASHSIYIQALKEGLIEDFMNAGAVVVNSGCGACFGKHQGLLAAGEVCISSTNRNFQGRMGSTEAQVYLASPVTVAASAISGEISGLEGI